MYSSLLFVQSVRAVSEAERVTKRHSLKSSLKISSTVRHLLRSMTPFAPDDLVHRPPNQEQMRQLKELLLEEQKAIAQLIALVEQHLE